MDGFFFFNRYHNLYCSHIPCAQCCLIPSVFRNYSLVLKLCTREHSGASTRHWTTLIVWGLLVCGVDRQTTVYCSLSTTSGTLRLTKSSVSRVSHWRDTAWIIRKLNSRMSRSLYGRCTEHLTVWTRRHRTSGNFSTEIAKMTTRL